MHSDSGWLKNPYQHVLWVCGWLLFALPVYAHAPLEGFGSFSSGFLHPLVIPAQVLLIISLGLLAGRQGGQAIKYTLILFLLSMLPGVFLSHFIVVKLELTLCLAALALSGVLVSGRFLPVCWPYAFAVISGLLIGTDSLIDSFVDKERYFSLLGAIVGSYLLLIYSSGIAEYLQPLKQGIAIRVIGAWIAASCLMVSALSVLI